MFIILLHVFLHTFQNGHGVRLNTGITGGNFQHNKNMDSHVVLANSGVGPRMCVEDCMLYNGCNAVNFKLEDLVCELLTVSYPGDSLSDSDGGYFTDLSDWTQV